MSCCGTPNKFSDEFRRRYKPENHAGCCCGGTSRNSCTSPSLAEHGTPRWRWEQIYGKLITKVTIGQDAQGHTVQFVEKTPCPLPEPKRPDPLGNCSFTYRVIR